MTEVPSEQSRSQFDVYTERWCRCYRYCSVCCYIAIVVAAAAVLLLPAVVRTVCRMANFVAGS